MGARQKIKSFIARMPGGGKLVLLYRTMRMPKKLGGLRDSKELFTARYKNKLWGDWESASGPGSTLEYTQNLRSELPPLLKKLGVRRLLDAPCGDFHWFRLVRAETDFEYIGGDIVAEMVADNQAKFADPRTRFVQLDITRDPLPSADAWLCRDVLFHLSDREVFYTLHNLLKSDIAYFLSSSHPDCQLNTDIPTGIFRQQNLLLPPYSLPEPMHRIEDWIEGTLKRHLCLWTRAQIEEAMGRNKAYQRAVARLATEAKPAPQR